MSQEDEFAARRNSVKRSGKRITVDMRKQLDSLMDECFTDGAEENNITTTTTSDINATHSNSNPSHTTNSIQENDIQNNNNIKSNNSNNNNINTDSDTTTLPNSTTEDKPPISQPKTPRLQYSNSQNKISFPKFSDGNGRSSTIPAESSGIDTENYKEDKQEKQNVSPENELNAVSPKSIPLSVSVPVSASISNSNTSPMPSPTTPTSQIQDSKERRSLFFDNAASRVVKAVIITTNTVHSPQGAYTSYVMEVSSEGGMVVQNVSKRFKNFTELVDKLKDTAPELSGMLPARVVLGNMAAKLVSQRKVQLQILLDYILNHKDLSRNVDVHAFFRNPTLLAQLASKPDMEGYVQKGTLGIKYIQMWALLKNPCLYFCMSPSETAELKSSVILRWLTVEIVDEMSFTFELRPWQHLSSEPQSKPTPIRASSREEMLNWVRAIHRVKATVSNIIMLKILILIKKTMLLEEDSPSEAEIGEDEDEHPTETQANSNNNSKSPPTLSLSGDSITKPNNDSATENSELLNNTTLPPSQRPTLTRSRNSAIIQKSDNIIPTSTTASPDLAPRTRNQTQPIPVVSPKLVARSQTESQLSLLARSKDSASSTSSTSSTPSTSSTSSPSLSPVISANNTRHSTPVAKLKEFVEKPDISPLSRFEARMASMKQPPKYPPPSPGKMQARTPSSNPLLLTSHTPTPDTDENILLSATKQQYIRGATANKLFEKVIDHTFTGTEYLDLVSAFLIGYRTFATPTELLDRLIQAYHYYQFLFFLYNQLILHNFHVSGPATSLRLSSGLEKPEACTTRLCICNFLSKWIDFHLHDFLSDANLVNKLITFLDSNMQSHVAHNERTAIEKVKTTIKKKTRDGASFSEDNQPPSILPTLFHSLCGNGNVVPFLVMDFDKTEVARHLCILEFEAFSKILPTECLNQAWNKKEKETKAANITSIIKRFNEVSCWVSSMLVTTEELKARTALLTRLIEIADECRQFNNFNSVVAIVSGLESSAVHRLKKTWGGLSPQAAEAFEQLKSLMSTEKNYLTYRNVVKLANPPCIPYLGVFLTDLVFIDEAPDVLQPSGLINFDKWYKVAWVVREIRKFQVTKYSFRVVPEVINTLTQLPVLPENEIYSLSLKCEERAKA